jgi:ATP-dependent DNA helicase RecG
VVALGARLSTAVGGTAKVLEDALGLRTVGDLLRHYPRRYVERGALTPFSDLVVGEHAPSSPRSRRSPGSRSGRSCTRAT